MKQDIQELRDLPLTSLISAPLNAVIAAETSAAMSTVAFVEKIAFLSSEERRSIFDRQQATDKSEVRVARLVVKKSELDESQSPPVKREVEEIVEIPFVTLFNVPSLGIESMDWDFHVKLKSIQEIRVEFTHSETLHTTGGGSVGLGLHSLGIPIDVGVGMKVEATTKTDFQFEGARGRDQEYNLNIKVRANRLAQPRGIERFLTIAERIAAENEAVNKAVDAAGT